MSGKGRSFSTAVNAKLRDIAKELRLSYASDHAFAKALKVSQPTVTNFLNGGNAGLQLAMVIAQAASLTLVVERGAVRIGAPTSTGTPWRELPGWDDAVADARKMFPRVTDAAWSWLGSLVGDAVPGLSAAALGMMASAYDQATPMPGVADEAARPARSGLRAKGRSV